MCEFTYFSCGHVTKTSCDLPKSKTEDRDDANGAQSERSSTCSYSSINGAMVVRPADRFSGVVSRTYLPNLIYCNVSNMAPGRAARLETTVRVTTPCYRCVLAEVHTSMAHDGPEIEAVKARQYGAGNNNNGFGGQSVTAFDEYEDRSWQYQTPERHIRPPSRLHAQRQAKWSLTADSSPATPEHHYTPTGNQDVRAKYGRGGSYNIQDIMAHAYGPNGLSNSSGSGSNYFTDSAPAVSSRDGYDSGYNRSMRNGNGNSYGYDSRVDSDNSNGYSYGHDSRGGNDNTNGYSYGSVNRGGNGNSNGNSYGHDRRGGNGNTNGHSYGHDSRGGNGNGNGYSYVHANQGGNGNINGYIYGQDNRNGNGNINGYSYGQDNRNENGNEHGAVGEGRSTIVAAARERSYDTPRSHTSRQAHPGSTTNRYDTNQYDEDSPLTNTPHHGTNHHGTSQFDPPRPRSHTNQHGPNHHGGNHLQTHNSPTAGANGARLNTRATFTASDLTLAGTDTPSAAPAMTYRYAQCDNRYFDPHTGKWSSF